MGISFEYLHCMVTVFLAFHLSSCKIIEDCRKGFQGEHMKLVPTCPNHPTRKFRIIQLWDDGPIATTKSVKDAAAPAKKPPGETFVTRFRDRSKLASSRRRWLHRRPSILKEDLVPREIALAARYKRVLECVERERANREEWQRKDDGLDSFPAETVKEYCDRVEPPTRQRW
jgi:hypothetical protein